MVFAEAAWLRRWGSFSKDSPRQQKEQNADGCHALAPFDAADAMERGLIGPTPSAEEDRLLEVTKKEQHLRVKVLKDGIEHRLTDEEGELQLVARRREDCSVDIYLASEGTDGVPSFKMTFDEDKNEFRLMHFRQTGFELQPKCQELLRITQTLEKIGKGRCIYLGVTVHDPVKRTFQQLGSKRPVWNKRLQSLTMDFGGRCDKASPRNFQMCPPDDEDTSLMFFGKIGRNTFAMDYVEPLGALHAFAIAISTQHWEG
eukprot:gnl/MRDRNA2_/MRDRNA2_92365_c0_seq1.p1 gnl/MRDRNA2_/MRDRNA2_92365_c0~~gnl/MRDRNA2_/MRDRNA2_92365_c0_seq1.p1  ORF type:complete len:258 (+),score=65.20 gnl/MRDRNA2_/MRDRNA2_92365_c0_seq1:82-855(+)